MPRWVLVTSTRSTSGDSPSMQAWAATTPSFAAPDCGYGQARRLAVDVVAHPPEAGAADVVTEPSQQAAQRQERAVRGPLVVQLVLPLHG